MSRDKKVRLGEDEKELLRSTREVVYGDDNVPYGLVIAKGCKALLAEDEDNNDGVNF